VGIGDVRLLDSPDAVDTKMGSSLFSKESIAGAFGLAKTAERMVRHILQIQEMSNTPLADLTIPCVTCM
jgi:hypothetical protein